MNRVVIIGCGNVGLSYLHKLCLTDMSLDISLIDLDEEKVIGEILDIEQSLIYRNSNINLKLGTYDDCNKADIIVICAGVPQSSNDRLKDLEKANKIIVDITNRIRSTEFKGVYLVACNPLDVITELSLIIQIILLIK